MVAPVQTSSVIAASYERVSTRTQGQYGFSLGVQRQNLEGLAAERGWVLPANLMFRDGEDENASGTRWDLPALSAMLDAARRKEFTVLLTPDLDRFARSLAKGLALEEQLRRYGVTVVYQRVPTDDSPEGQMQKHMLFAFAEYERQKTILRTANGRRGKAESGRVVGNGIAPYGHRFTYETLANGTRRVAGLELDPPTAPRLREILLSLRTRSIIGVVNDLNDRKIPSPTGGRWNRCTLDRLARKPLYRGEASYAGITIRVPALLSDAEWFDLQRALDRRRMDRRGQRPPEEDAWTLRSRLRCGHCHGNLRVKANNGTRYYGCDRHQPAAARRRGKDVCALPDVHAGHVEAECWRLVTETLLDRDRLAAGLAAGVAQHQHADHLRTDRLAALDAEIAKHRDRLDRLVGELLDLGPASRDAVRKRMADVEDLIARLETERAELAAVRPDGISREEADGVATFAAEIRDGLALAEASDRREVLRTLDLRGVVQIAPDGVKFGLKHRYRIDWTARIPLSRDGTPYTKEETP